jgi:hypothetical protein
MPEYKIEGARRDTGQDVLETIAAINRQDAERKAQNQGILISRVQESASLPSYLGLRVASGILTANAAIFWLVSCVCLIYAIVLFHHPAPPSPPTAPDPAKYQAPAGSSADDVQRAADLYAAAREDYATTMDRYNLQVISAQEEQTQEGFEALGAAATMFCAGALLLAIADGCSALRDIARNSFK